MTDRASHTKTARATGGSAWWRGAVIYQIYPRSFCDSTGDGVGDLHGATSKLDHIAGLGVDAIWLSPFFASPMRDFGYDVSDYCAVDPVFGDLADFDAFLDKAHALGLKVIIDQVYSHTSDQHAWFQQSRTDASNPKADWYVWADPKPDGAPPNNWQSVFGGGAWEWDSRRRQYYLHNFLPSQPDLNLHNEAVQDAILDVARFWLDRGVDGFRLDALNFAMHDPQLRDNPPRRRDGGELTRPFDYQDHRYNRSHGDIVKFIARLRALTDDYGDIFTVAEVVGDAPDDEMKRFTRNNVGLKSAYNFSFLYADGVSGDRVASAIRGWRSDADGGWPSWAFSNHDAPRHVSRWAPPEDRRAAAKLFAMALVCLRGAIFIYQGEELGLPQARVAFEDLRDPEAIANWPATLGRDGARTPFPWNSASTYGGFSDAAPWLPMDPRHRALALDLQEADSASVLHVYRTMIALRKSTPALRFGSLSLVTCDGDLLIFKRRFDEGETLCVFNLGTQTVAPAPEDIDGYTIIQRVGDVRSRGGGDSAAVTALGPFSGFVASNDRSSA